MSAMAPLIVWAMPGIGTWTAYSEEVRAELTGTAVLADGELVLIDPIPLPDSALAGLTALGSPRAILLTSANHQRSSREYAEKLGVPVYAPLLARQELRADVWFVPGDPVLPCGMEAISLPGFAVGESAFYLRDLGALVLGDAVVNLPSRGPEILPEKYCGDRSVGIRSLHALKELKFDLVCLAHGAPLTRDGFMALISSQALA